MATSLNGIFISFIMDKYKNANNILTVLVLVAGLNLRIYGTDLDGQMGGMITNSAGFLFCLPLYMYCNQSLVNINHK